MFRTEVRQWDRPISKIQHAQWENGNDDTEGEDGKPDQKAEDPQKKEKLNPEVRRERLDKRMGRRICRAQVSEVIGQVSVSDGGL